MQSPMDQTAQPWTVKDSERLYRIADWSQGYFGMNELGRVVARPDTTRSAEIDLLEIVEGLRARDLSPPILLRFSDILAHRIRCLNEAFQAAILENEYKGGYTAVYPIKVNQQRQVVKHVLDLGAEFGVGLEAGSKPELLAVLALTADTPSRLIVCNGFKDDDYAKAVVLATKLGRTIIPVVENLSELRHILKWAEHYAVRPQLGARVKLSTRSEHRWGTSMGAKAKFGLSMNELVEMFSLLTARGLEDCLKLVHCHPGSQLRDIQIVKEVIDELGQVYAELVRMGASVEFLDVGGGLAVDYSGAKTGTGSSMNYSLEEYSRDVVYRIANVCNQKRVPHPTLITESGRAMVAHHSVLVFNVLGASTPTKSNGASTVADCDMNREELPRPILDLVDALEAVADGRLVECYHDAVRGMEQVVEAFKLGYITLPQRALADNLFWAVSSKIQESARRLETWPEELDELEEALGDLYFCNISVFQSLPDSWAIGQLFPILPIHRLDEQPHQNGVLVDITCDSDGRIGAFIDEDGTRPHLPLHELRDGSEYYLAAFLVGAYQETLGDLHNLFGDTNVVHIRSQSGDWRIEEVIKGDTAREVLSYVRYEVERLQPALAHECEEAVRARRLTLGESQALLRFYDSALNGYTYLESDSTE